MLSTYELFSIMEPKIFDIFEAPTILNFYFYLNKQGKRDTIYLTQIHLPQSSKIRSFYFICYYFKKDDCMLLCYTTLCRL